MTSKLESHSNRLDNRANTSMNTCTMSNYYFLFIPKQTFFEFLKILLQQQLYFKIFLAHGNLVVENPTLSAFLVVEWPWPKAIYGYGPSLLEEEEGH